MNGSHFDPICEPFLFLIQDVRTVEDRRKTLQSYLRQIVILLTQTAAELTECPSKAKLVRAIPLFG